MDKKWKFVLSGLPVILIAFMVSGLYGQKTVAEQSCAEIFNQLSADEKILWTHGYVSALSNVALAADGYISYMQQKAEESEEDAYYANMAIVAVQAFVDLFNYGGTVRELSNEIESICAEEPQKPVLDAAFEAYKHLTNLEY